MLEALAADGVYRSQFETLTSNGGLTAYPGGERWMWKTLFLAGRMSMPAQTCARNMGRLITGTESLAAHRALGHHIFECAEACWSEPHSVTRIAFEPSHFGTAEKCQLIRLAERERTTTDILDNYIEAHIHGIINIENDVEALVLDSCYKGTEIETLAHRLACPVEWHPGYRLPESRISNCSDYRGPEIAKIARKLVNNGFITPYDIGLARRKITILSI